MLKVNDFVNHFIKFGIGIVREINKFEATVEFLNGGLKHISIGKDGNSSFLVKLNDDMVRYLLDDKMIADYNSNTVLKGLDYFSEKRVRNISYGSDSIKAIVTGSRNYAVEITFSNKKKIYECSCPVNGFCKHCMALLLTAQYELKRLLGNIELNTILPTNKKVEKEEIYLDFDEFKFDNLNQVYKTSMIFDQKYAKKLDFFICELKKYSLINQEKIDDIIAMLYLKDSSSHVLYSILKREDNTQLLKCYKKMKSEIDSEYRTNYYWYKHESHWTLLQQIYNNEFDIIVRNVDHYDWSTSELLKFLLTSNVLNQYNLRDLFLEKIKTIYFSDEMSEVLIDNLPREILLQIFFDLKIDNISINVFFKVFNKEDVLEFLYTNYSSEFLNYVLDNINFYYQFNSKKLMQVLAINSLRSKKTFKSKINKIIAKFPNTEYVLAYCNDTLDNLLLDENGVDYNSFIAYFDFDYELEMTKEAVYVHKNIKILDENVATVIEEVLSKKLLYNNMYKPGISKLNELLDDILTSKFGDKYKGDIREKVIEFNLIIKKKLIHKFNEDIDNLTFELDDEPLFLSAESKIDVDFYLNYYDKWTLSLKVGRDKKYVVKNLSDFIDYIEHNQFYEYGKGLAFCHCYENFNDKVVPVLKFLSIIDSYQFNTKEAIIPQYRIGELIKTLKGNKIYFNNIDYLVRLDNFDFKVEINKNYEITTNTRDYYLHMLGKNVFVFDPINHVVDMIDENRNIGKVITLLKRYDSYSIEDNLDSFKEKIYYRFNDLIEICDEIKNEFAFNEIEIKAYFDYVHKKIVVKTEIFDSEGLSINFNNLKDFEKSKYLRFEAYLKNIGFNDNELIEENKIYNFLTMDFSELRKLANIYLSESITSKAIENFPKQTIVLNNEFSMLSAFVAESAYSDEELYEILKAIKLKKKFVLLKNNTIINIDNAEATEFYDTVSDLKLNTQKLSENQQLPIYKAITAYAHLNNCKLDEYFLNMIDEIADFKTADIQLPSINGELRKYQKEGFNWLSILSKYHLGGILADDMGLGKTIQIITLLKANNVLKPSLIVCPKTLIFNWKSEFQKFDSDAKVIEIYGNASTRKEIIDLIDYEENAVYITSYDSLRSDIELYQKEFKYLVLDEAQVIKNVYAGKSQAVKNIKAEYRFALTGTPVENNIIDLWSIFDFIMPGYFEELSEFKQHYNSDKSFVEHVSKRITPFILRRTKANVLKDLPNKYERIITVPMTTSQRKIYDSIKLQAQNILSTSNLPFDLFPYLLKLRQICIDPNLFIQDYEGTSSKMEMLEELIVDYINDGHKILIFSQFVKALDIVREYLNNNSIKHFYLTGQTPALERKKYADEFNANNDIKVFLISLKAGGTGLNLIGADTVIHLDPWWNQAVERQATDRTYRIGQQKNVEVIKLICEDSIEKRVIELQNIKKDLIDKLIANDDSNITKLSKEDLSFILK